MKTHLIFLLLAGLTLMTSCEKDDEASPASKTIVDIAIADPQFSTLVSALERTNLVSTLQGPGPFTVFAPTNTAFSQLGVDLAALTDAELTDILLYHVIPGKVASNDLIEGQTYATTASTNAPGGNQLSVLIEKSTSGVQLNGASSLTTADVSADNGIVHIIDAVILPLDIVGHASANSNFTTLVNALATAPGDLVNVLSSDGPLSVFAPLNSGFAAIESTVAALTPDQLATVLTYHVVGNANVRAADLTEGMQVETVSGQTFVVGLENGPMLTDQTGQISNILLTDVQTTNGVIHVLESVIIPNL
ncbi:MAG: fasciclin domain-containing protein [Saprospiraceae bacterium]|nr:fasciclin domain-containing protein [Saprospiraceae bacterium]